jgi:cyclopropane fatty-acyl-phospholipid synthase-like methyltransferase
MSVYDNVPPGELEKFAEDAGLGGKVPADFSCFIKYIKNNDKILEVGCGTGRLGKLFLKKYNYIGIDNHKPYLEYFKNNLKKIKQNNVDDILILSSFEDYSGTDFDVIIFSWTVIGDFSKKEQLRMIKKAKKMLKGKGLILIDNPAKGTTYNEDKDYMPCKFYFDDWKSELSKIFNNPIKLLYDTPVGRVRELVVLEK